MKTAIFLAVASLASTVSAAAIAYNEPISATIWKLSPTKNTFKVSWRSGCEPTDTKIYDIKLQVQRNNLQVDAGIAAIGKLDCSDKEGSATSYSALFTINNPAVPAPSTTAPAATSAPAASSTPSTIKPSVTSGSGNATASVTNKPTATKDSSAGALKVGSTAALLVVAAVGLML
ncbi:hypothetical protein BGX27_004520 [Mortierella sp. AM989]|nr:hypothetical protein BGX27_004520 [Mortierella sp. AM989]